MHRTARVLIAVGASLLAARAGSLHAQVDTLFVVPGSHFDLGFTDTPRRVLEWRILVLDGAIQTAIERDDFHWFEEAGLVFDAWWSRNRDEAELLAQVRRLLQEGRLGVGATWVTPLAGALPEATRTLMTHVDDLAAAFGYRPAVAVLNDVPLQPQHVIDALAARGIRYLLIGANLFISGPLPQHLVRTPFWWEATSGRRVLAYIDPDSYMAALSEWGIGPRCARAFAPDRFGGMDDDMALMRAGIERRLAQTTRAFDAVIVQHAFDNWDAECAAELGPAASQWNDSGATPHIVIGPPERYFRHIEARYGDVLPVLRGSGAMEWEHQHVALMPVWTWRLREAARALPAGTWPDAEEALATALDHNLGLGQGGPGLAEWQVVAHSRQSGEVLARAVRLVLGDGAVSALPQRTAAVGPPPAWVNGLLAEAPLLRAGERQLGPWVRADTVLDVPLLVSGAPGDALLIEGALDRRRVPGSDERFVNVVIDVALATGGRALSLAPAPATAWLLGDAPRAVLGADGVVIRGLDAPLYVRSPLIRSWLLLPHPERANLVLLRGLVAAQSTRVELRRGEARVLPFEVLFPGEPVLLPIEVRIEQDPTRSATRP